MKRKTNKIISVILILTLMIGTALFEPTSASAASDSQRRIASWAEYLYNTTWTAKKDVTGWRYTFTKGGTYRLPYSQPVNTNGYIGYGISVDGFLSAANDVNSKLYTDSSTYNRTSTYYGLDCSAFVSLCWGTKRQTTYSIPNISTKIGVLSDYIDSVQLGDALNYRDSNEQHVILVTGVTYVDGKVTEIEITEETPPQLKRTIYTRAALLNRYNYYIVYRYTGSVPEPPAAYRDPVIDEYCYADTSSASVICPAVRVTNPESVSSVSFTVWDDSGKQQTFDGVSDGYGVWSRDINVDDAGLTGTVYCRCRVLGNNRFDSSADFPALEIGGSQKLLGDANGDERVDSIDATLVQRVATNVYVPYDEAQLMLADVDNDGYLTSVDATFIMRYSIHMYTPYPVGEPV